MLCGQESSYLSIEDTAKAWSRSTDRHRQSLALCPSSCSVPGPGSLSRAAALWKKSFMMLCTSLWGFSGVMGWVSTARIWSGKAAGAASVSSSCPHVARAHSSQPQERPPAPKAVHQPPAHGCGEEAVRWTVRPWAAGNVNQGLFCSACCPARVPQRAGRAQEAVRGHSRAPDPQWPEGTELC